MLRLKLSAIALAESNDAISYYRNISQKLGTAFRTELTRSLDLLRQRPDIGSNRFAHLFPGLDVRAWSIDRFPYQVLYTADHRTLRVIRISHERRPIGAV